MAEKSKKLIAYLAAPLFNEAERSFNIYLSSVMEQYMNVYLPQRDGGLISEMINKNIEVDKAVATVFNRDMNAIINCDIVVAVLDGRSIDEGVAFELGVAYSLTKRCIGFQTDSRRLASWGNNPMIAGSLEKTFNCINELNIYLKNIVEEHEKNETNILSTVYA